MGELTIPCQSLLEFDIHKYTPFTYYVSKKREKVWYFKCKQQPKLGCGATANVTQREGNAILKFFGDHGHPVEEKRRLYHKTKEKMVELIEENPNVSPSEVLSKITSKLSLEELKDCSSVPTKQQISDQKYSFVHSSYPSNDHFWKLLVSHGQFDGATRFVRYFSLQPLIIIFATEEGLLRCNSKYAMHFVDGTHSFCSPSLVLTAILCYENGNSKYLFTHPYFCGMCLNINFN